MTGIVGRWYGSRCREMPQVAVGNFWFVGVLKSPLCFPRQAITDPKQFGAVEARSFGIEETSLDVGVRQPRSRGAEPHQW